jgi:5-methylcytosine-specific restriction endonuclease McrA
LILAHLNEVERRDLHLKLGHRSMFDYCTSGLGYSASAAGRRIQSARSVARFPELYDLLAKNDVNLSTVSQVSRILTAANKNELLSRIRGRSQREVEAIVAEFQPRELPRDRVRTVVVRVPAPAGAAPAQGVPAAPTLGTLAAPVAPGTPAVVDATPDAFPASEPSKDPTPVRGHSRNGSDGRSLRRTLDESRTRTPTKDVERRVLIQFCAGPEFMAKFDRVRVLAWHRLPAGASLEHVLEMTLDRWIDREDPARRRARRETRAQRKQDARRPNGRARASNNARHIPTAVRDDVFVRDGGRCAFLAPNGRRCGATQGLQVDHITPVARGGGNSPGNLRLLCAYHNRLEAARLLGPDIATRRAPQQDTG